MVQGVIFDLGGTLIRRTVWHERQCCGAVAAFARRVLGYPYPAALAEQLHALRKDGERHTNHDLIERPAVQTIRSAFHAAGLPVDETTLQDAERVLFAVDVGQSRLYPGAEDVLTSLRQQGLRVALLSNITSHQAAVDILRTNVIESYFDPILTSALLGRVKPHPSAFLSVVEQWQCAPEDVVMIGDTIATDIAGASAVRMRSILVEVEPRIETLSWNQHPVILARITDLREIPNVLRAIGAFQ